MKIFVMGKAFRVKRRNDIDAIFKSPQRVSDAAITLFSTQNGLEYSRMAAGVSKRHGNAVRRNRIKRLCREAFRLARPELPKGWDYMIIPRAGVGFTLEKLKKSIKALAWKSERQQER